MQVNAKEWFLTEGVNSMAFIDPPESMTKEQIVHAMEGVWGDLGGYLCGNWDLNKTEMDQFLIQIDEVLRQLFDELRYTYIEELNETISRSSSRRTIQWEA